jgi:hypothetical protein
VIIPSEIEGGAVVLGVVWPQSYQNVSRENILVRTAGNEPWRVGLRGIFLAIDRLI